MCGPLPHLFAPLVVYSPSFGCLSAEFTSDRVICHASAIFFISFPKQSAQPDKQQRVRGRGREEGMSGQGSRGTRGPHITKRVLDPMSGPGITGYLLTSVGFSLLD